MINGKPIIWYCALSDQMFAVYSPNHIEMGIQNYPQKYIQVYSELNTEILPLFGFFVLRINTKIWDKNIKNKSLIKLGEL